MADDIDLTPTRELSRSLFGGAQYRIEVGAAIAEWSGPVSGVELLAALGDPPGKSNVNAELKVLERAGLLRRDEALRRDRSDRRVPLRRKQSLYWRLCKELRDATAKTR